MKKLTYKGRILDAFKSRDVNMEVEVRSCYLTEVYATMTSTSYDRVVVARKREGSRKGGLHFTLQLNRAVDLPNASQYIVLTAMALQQTLLDYEITSKVKWPTTVTVMHKDIAEMSVVYKKSTRKNAVFITVSVGVKEEPADNQTTLTRQAVNVTREELLAHIVANFLQVEQDYYKKVADSYRKIGKAIGKTIIADGKRGKAIGLSQDGYLLVDYNGNIDKVTTEDVEIVED